MINLSVTDNKELVHKTGVLYKGEKGIKIRVELPAYIDGVDLGTLDSGHVYVEYGASGSEVYEDVELTGLVGVQTEDIPDEIIASAGTISLWAEFADAENTVLLKTNVISLSVENHKEYSDGAD